MHILLSCSLCQWEVADVHTSLQPSTCKLLAVSAQQYIRKCVSFSISFNACFPLPHITTWHWWLIHIGTERGFTTYVINFMVCNASCIRSWHVHPMGLGRSRGWEADSAGWSKVGTWQGPELCGMYPGFCGSWASWQIQGRQTRSRWYLLHPANRCGFFLVYTSSTFSSDYIGNWWRCMHIGWSRKRQSVV